MFGWHSNKLLYLMLLGGRHVAGALRVCHFCFMDAHQVLLSAMLRPPEGDLQQEEFCRRRAV